MLLPRIELPPLSPGIQERVIEEDVVLDTVSLGWSGGTRQKIVKKNRNESQMIMYDCNLFLKTFIKELFGTGGGEPVKVSVNLKSSLSRHIFFF